MTRSAFQIIPRINAKTSDRIVLEKWLLAGEEVSVCRGSSALAATVSIEVLPKRNRSKLVAAQVLRTIEALKLQDLPPLTVSLHRFAREAILKELALDPRSSAYGHATPVRLGPEIAHELPADVTATVEAMLTYIAKSDAVTDIVGVDTADAAGTVHDPLEDRAAPERVEADSSGGQGGPEAAPVPKTRSAGAKVILLLLIAAILATRLLLG